MGIFSKRISTQAWVASVVPWYDLALPITRKLDSAVENDSLQDTIDVVGGALAGFPQLAAAIKAVPNPTSQEVKRAKKKLTSALNHYKKAAGIGHKIARFTVQDYQDMQRGSFSVVYSKVANSRWALAKASFENLVNFARADMAEAAAFLSSAREIFLEETPGGIRPFRTKPETRAKQEEVEKKTAEVRQVTHEFDLTGLHPANAKEIEAIIISYSPLATECISEKWAEVTGEDPMPIKSNWIVSTEMLFSSCI